MRSPLHSLAPLAALALAGCWTPVLELPPGMELRELPPGAADAPPRRDVKRAYHDRERGVVSRELPLLHFPDGRLVRDGVERGWYEDGSPRLEQVWDMGRRVGVWRKWGPDGELLLEVDRGDGVTPAPMRFWHPGGVLAGEGLGIDGVKEDLWVTWHPSGVERSRGRYANGLKEGAWIHRDEEGRIVARGRYAGGRRVGNWELVREGAALAGPPPTWAPGTAPERAPGVGSEQEGRGRGQRDHQEPDREGARDR